MKKLILSLALVFSVTFAYSQLFNVGPKIGYNSTLSLNNLDYNSQKFGDEFFGNMHFGAFARLNFGKVYVQPELLYSMQKKDYKFSLKDVVDGGENLNYNNLVKTKAIDVPILVGYKVLDLKIVSLRAFAGPKLRFNAGSAFDLNQIGQGNNLDINNEVKNAKIGFELGAGVDVLMLTFDVRYSYVGNLYETTFRDAAKETLDGISTSGLILTLGWKIL